MAGWPISFYEMSSTQIIVVETIEENWDLRLEDQRSQRRFSSDKNRYVLNRLNTVNTLHNSSLQTPIVETDEREEEEQPESKFQKLRPSEKSKQLIQVVKQKMSIEKLLSGVTSESIAEIATLTDKGGWNAVHYAASTANLEAIEYFIKHGCNLEAETKEGWTALTIAANKNKSESRNNFL